MEFSDCQNLCEQHCATFKIEFSQNLVPKVALYYENFGMS